LQYTSQDFANEKVRDRTFSACDWRAMCKLRPTEGGEESPLVR
jgi:hypothetical protein